jgi:Uncharacterized conserved protein
MSCTTSSYSFANGLHGAVQAPILKEMQLVFGQVRKPIRELRSSLRKLPDDPPQKAVHNLRTRSRRVEAITSALASCSSEQAQKVLRSIKSLRKAAGNVRDMDVLIAKVRSLHRQCPDPAFDRLLAHIQEARQESAGQLVKEFSSKRKKVCHRLDRFSLYVKEHFGKCQSEAHKANELFDELCHWPALTAGNLHDFRIRLKELRYMLQLTRNANMPFMSALERAKTHIGVWHDWEELHRIAAEVLDASRERNAIAMIANRESENLRTAMRAARSLRTRFMRAGDSFQATEP